MSQVILTMGKSVSLINALLQGVTNQRLFFSYGEEIPDLSGSQTAYWMGGRYALQLRQVGAAKNLCSPGADWLPSLDSALTGRKIYSGGLEDLMNFGCEKMWVKPSEAKIPDLPAAMYSPAEVQAVFLRNAFTSEINLQWCPTSLNLDYEHRFFIAEGEVISGSPYKVGGRGIMDNFSEYSNALDFAANTARSIQQVSPPFYVLDVALNVDTHSWIIVEANRPWSSGFYGCEPTATLEVVEASSNYSETRWAWQPDEHLIQLSQDWLPLKVIPAGESSLGFIEYQTEAPS